MELYAHFPAEIDAALGDEVAGADADVGAEFIDTEVGLEVAVLIEVYSVVADLYIRIVLKQ